MEQARVLDEELRHGRSRGPLHGRTISIKDLIDVKGVPTTAASRVRAGHIAAADAPVVARLRDAGAVIIGKTNLHEFALGTTSDESAFGPVRNPHDPNRSPGGSSGGSGAAVAAGMGWASIGTDTGGSIRIPASACGVVGLKPAFGEITTVGVVPLSVSLDHVGPLAASVADAWAIYDALTGSGHQPESASPIGGVRLGRLGGYFLETLDDDVRAQIRGSAEPFEGCRRRDCGRRAPPPAGHRSDVRERRASGSVCLPLGCAEACAGGVWPERSRAGWKWAGRSRATPTSRRKATGRR